MAYQGYSGSGFVGNFATPTALEFKFPAANCAGRTATVDAGGGNVYYYVSNGSTWSILNPGSPGMLSSTIMNGILRTRAKSGRLKILFVGDSTDQGAGSNNTSVGLRSLSYPALFAAELTSMGFPTNIANWFGVGGQASTANLVAQDPRLTLAVDWILNSNDTIGGKMLSNATGTGSLSFRPVEAWDTADIWYFQNTTNATCTVNKDGGATLSTINMAGSSAVVKATVSTGAAASVGTLNLQRNGVGTGAFIIGMDLYDSANPGISVWNGGWAGSSTSSWVGASGPYAPLNMMSTLGQDMTIFGLGVNDMNGAGLPGLDLYTSRYQQLITAAKVLGPAVIEKTVQSNPATFATLDVWNAYMAVVDSLAVSNSLYVNNRNAALGGSYAAAVTNGYMFDDRHPIALGNAAQALPLAKALFNGIH